jgi:hypothetical protein
MELYRNGQLICKIINQATYNDGFDDGKKSNDFPPHLHHRPTFTMTLQDSSLFQQEEGDKFAIRESGKPDVAIDVIERLDVAVFRYRLLNG